MYPPAPIPRPRWPIYDWVLIASILILALILRVVQLDFQPLWWDEGYSVFFATRDMLTMLARTAVDIHPPFYYALLQLWLMFFGQSVVALRLLSVMIGLASVPLIYVVGCQLFNRPVGLIAALLLAVSPLHIYYSQEVRMYGLLTLFALGSIALQIELLRRDGNRAVNSIPKNSSDRELVAGSGSKESLGSRNDTVLWVAYALVTAGALYVHYYAAFLLAAEFVVVLHYKYRTRVFISMRRWILAWFLVTLLYLPWAIYAGLKLINYVTAKVGIENYAPLDPITFLAQHAVAFSAGHLSGWTWLGTGAILTVALVFTGVWLSLRSNSSRSTNTADAYLLCAIYCLVPLILAFIVNLVAPFHPFGFERTMLFLLPIFLILVAQGIVALLKRKRALGYLSLASVLVLAALSLYDFYTVNRYSDEDYRPLISEMQSLAQRGDIALAVYPWQIGYLEAYYRGAPMDFFEVPSATWIANDAQMDREITQLRADHPRTWLLAYQKQGRLIEDRLVNAFSNDFVSVDEWYGNTRLEFYVQGNDPPMGQDTTQFAPDLRLSSYGIGEKTVSAEGGNILIRLLWQAGSDAYSYSLRLVDSTGEKRAQRDLQVLSGDQVAKIGLPIPRNLPAGHYTLQLVAYRQADGIPLVTANGQNEIQLGTLNIGK